jgi:hypothetical protein
MDKVKKKENVKTCKANYLGAYTVSVRSPEESLAKDTVYQS